ncbi:MAG: hypothetical protein ACOVNL_03785 [Prochlorococcaceae cyanobacterium]
MTAAAHLHVAAVHVVEFAVGVVEQAPAGLVTHQQDPVAAAPGLSARTVMEKAGGHREAGVDLALQQQAAAVSAEAGQHAVVGAGGDLGRRLGGVAMALHLAQEVIVGVGALEGLGAQVLHRHGRGAREAHPQGLAGDAAVGLHVVLPHVEMAAESGRGERLDHGGSQGRRELPASPVASKGCSGRLRGSGFRRLNAGCTM